LVECAQKMKHILLVGAHPDDIELGCGASVALLAAQKITMTALVLTAGEKGGNPTKYNRRQEARTALHYLGVQNVVFADLPDTLLFQHFNQLVQVLEHTVKQVQPERVYTHWSEDRHQDHQAVWRASAIACRDVPQTLSYETPSSGLGYLPQTFQPLSNQAMERKLHAIALHASQAQRDYTRPEYCRALAVFRGQQAGTRLAEGFVPYRYLL